MLVNEHELAANCCCHNNLEPLKAMTGTPTTPDRDVPRGRTIQVSDNEWERWAEAAKLLQEQLKVPVNQQALVLRAARTLVDDLLGSTAAS